MFSTEHTGVCILYYKRPTIQAQNGPILEQGMIAGIIPNSTHGFNPL